MFKKGQLAKSVHRNRYYRIERIISDGAVTVLCLRSGTRGAVLNEHLTLIGNNYKEKPHV